MTERLLTANSAVPLPSSLLDPAEKAVWWDRPDPQRYALHEAGFKSIFLLLFTAFAVFWMVFASRGGGFFWMFGLLHFAVGSWFLSEPLRRYRLVRSMTYLLTERRAIISTRRSTASFQVKSLRSIEVNDRGQSFGDVLFVDRQIPNAQWPNSAGKDGFIGITDADAVAREMRRLQAAA